MRFDFIFILIACIAAFILGCFVYFKNRKNIINKTWGFFSLNFSIWSFGYALMIGGFLSKGVTLFWARFSHFGAILIPVSVLHFYSAFLGIIDKERKKLVIGYILSFFLLILNFTSLFIKDIVPKLSLKYYFEPGIFYYIFTLMFFIYILYEHFVMFKAHKGSSGFHRNQIKYILLGSVIGFFGGATTFPLVFDIRMPPFGVTFIFLYPIIISYAIVEYNLMDLGVAIKELLARTLSFLTLSVAAYFSVVLVLKVANVTNVHTIIIFALFTMAIFYSLHRSFSAKISQKIRPRPDFQTMLKDYTEVDIMAQHTSRGLAELVVKRITDSLRPSVCSLMLLDEATGLYNIIASSGKDEEIKTIAFKQTNHLISALRNSHQTRLIVKDELDKLEFSQEDVHLIKRDLEILKSQISIPLILRGELSGLLNLGLKSSGELYTPEEIGFLFVFLIQSAFMMHFLDKVQKVHELEVKEERLAGITNLLVSFNHEIRNQLNNMQVPIMSGVESMVSAEDLEKSRQMAQEASNAMTMILDSVQDYHENCEVTSAIPTDIKTPIEQALTELKPKFDKIDAKITVHIAEYLPKLETYPTFAKLFFNLFINSYFALVGKKTRILNIKAYQTKDSQRPIEVTIADTGGDMLKAMQQDALTSGGSGGKEFPERANIGGVNFFIAKHIIEDHQGELIVSTNPPPSPDEPPGAIFTIRLPLTQNP